MKEAKIFIGGEQVDLFDRDKLRLALTYSIADINNIEARSSGFSKTITAPRTHNNDLIFGFGTDINSADALDQNERRTAHIEVGGTVLLRGFARINKNIIKNRNNTGQYQFVIIGDNGDWKEKLSEKNVNELDYSDQDHIYNKANIDLSETVSTDRDYVYPLINYGATLGGHPISGNNNIHDVLVEDRFFALNVKSILIKMFKDIGVKIASGFIDAFFFGKLYLPFTNDLFKHPDNFRDDNIFRAGLLSDITFDTNLFTPTGGFVLELDNETGAFFDTGNNFNTSTFEYTIHEKSKQNFKYQIEFLIPNGGKVEIDVRKNGVLFITGDIITIPSNKATIVKSETGFIDVNKNDTISILWTVVSNVAEIITLKKDNTIFSNDISLQITKGTNVELNENLPDINQLDFVKGIKDLFNLYFLYDADTRTVFIEPRDEFYKSRVIDWTDKFDKSKDEEITYLNDKLKKKIVYKYKSDSGDGLVNGIEKQDDIIIASQEITNPNKFVKDEQKLGTDAFAPTIMRPFDFIGLFVSKVPTLNKDAILVPDLSEKSTGFELRILFFDSIRNTESGESWFFEGAERTDYPYFYSVDVVSDNDNSLYYNNTRRSKGLFNKYYENLHDTLNNGRLYTAFFNLNDSDISNLDFRVPIFVKNTYYLLNKIINYDPLLKRTTKVELIRATNMDIQAITLEAEGGEGGIFVAAPIPIGQDPISEDEDPTIPTDINEVEKKTLVVTTGQNETGVVVKGADSHADFPDLVIYGPGLIAGKKGQTLIGSNNEQDENAQMILGGGNKSQPKTISKIDQNGTFKSGNGSSLVATINEFTVDVFFTDNQGESQIVVKTDNTIQA